MLTLYTTHCPKCKVIEAKLNAKGLEFDSVTDMDEIMNKGYQSVPVLEIDGEPMDFMKANMWINNYKKED